MAERPPIRVDFASDNVAPAAPEAMEALVRANAGSFASYGADAVVARAADLIRELLDADAEVRFVSSGTAANALALTILAEPFEAVLAHRHAHVLTDEAGAPGRFGAGLGLIPLDGASGRIDPATLDAALAGPELSHRQAPAALSLTNATEYGTLYEATALARLVGSAKAHGLGVHLDGARLANAAAGGCEPRSLARLGLDVLVVGGSKAGMPPTEALVVFDRALARRLDARLKQAGQLVSKARFLAAPWIGMLETGAWVRRAAHANAMARRLAERAPFPLAHPVESNAVFLTMDAAALGRLSAQGLLVHRFLDGSVRFMCSWATAPDQVDALAEALSLAAG